MNANIKLEVKNLSMNYDHEIALNNINFTVNKGEFLSILGPSGCGKTTLLRILIGMLQPTEGKIIKDGIDITNFKPSERGMGMVFQNYALFENMTAVKNVEYALKIKKENKNHFEEIHEKTIKILNYLGLQNYINKYPSELSGGQQQRVAIARTLMMDPEIILFDEPMSALDVATRLSLRKLLKEIQKETGTTMIYITHDQEEAFALSDRIMVMEDANVVQIDTPQNIIDHPKNEYIEKFVIANLKTKIESLKKYISI